MLNKKVEASATVVMNSLAETKRAAGIRVFNLTAGEPKITTAPAIIEAAQKFIARGEIFYPVTSGIAELRQLASTWLNREYSCNYSVDECLVVNGGKFGLYLLFQHLLQNCADYKGKEVLIPAPYWVSYPVIVNMFGGKATIIPSYEQTSWKISAADINNYATADSKILILNNACNPTGAVYSTDELRSILESAHARNILVIADEVYSGLVYDGLDYVSCGSFPEYKDNVVIIQSMSKNFAMTGWRIGFVFAPDAIIKPLVNLISQSISGVCIVSQYAAIAALKQGNQITHIIRDTMQKRRDLFLKTFKDAFGSELTIPNSALYILVPLTILGVTNLGANEFCLRALDEANVATVPGNAFGAVDYVRFSFAAKEDDLINGLWALAKWCKQL